MADWAALTRFLTESAAGRVLASFDDIETIVGDLPASARRHQAFWANSDGNSYSRAWRRAGYRASLAGVGPAQIVFVKDGTPLTSSADRGTAEGPVLESAAAAVVVGCVATKGVWSAPAKDLYQSERSSGRTEV